MAFSDESVHRLLDRSEDSLAPFPSLFAIALSSSPPSQPASTSPPRIRRWNSGAEGAPPRTLHPSQIGAHPPLNPIAPTSTMLDHSSCKGTVGPMHVACKLALRGRAVRPEALLTATRDSAHLLNNLRRRTMAEETLQHHDIEHLEWEKRFWLDRLFTEREGAAARRRGLSAAAHFRATGGHSPRMAASNSLTDALAARLMGAAPPHAQADASPLTPGLNQNMLNQAGGSLITNRLSLLSELLPRERGLSPSQQAARKFAPPIWTRVEADGTCSQPREASPPRTTALLSPRDEGRAPGAVSVARPDLAQKLLSE